MKRRKKVAETEDFIAKQFQIRILVIVDGNEDNASVGEEFFGDAETLRHKRQPFGVAVAVLGVNV